MMMRDLCSFSIIGCVNCFFKRCSMYLACQMDWTFCVYGIPSGRVGSAEKLCFNAHSDYSFFNLHIQHSPDSIPGCSAGSPSLYGNINKFTIRHLNCEFRRAEFFTIVSQADLPGKPASGRRYKDSRKAHFFSGTDNRNIFFHTHFCQIVGKIKMF